MHRPLIVTSFMLMFFALFDGINAYAVPLLLLQTGISKSATGLIMSTSSAAGAIFDLLLLRFVKKTNYRRIYLMMFGLAGLYPIVLYNAHVVGIFIIAMALWGMYFDLLQFGNLDFVSRRENKHDHAASFGVMESFRAAGYLLAPLLAGVLIVDAVGWEIGGLSYIFLAAGFLLYLLLRYITKHSKKEKIADYTFHHKGMFVELKILKKVGFHILPLIILAMFLNVHDAFFWTIGPLVSEDLSSTSQIGGLFLTLYFLPMLLAGWLIGRISRRLGRHKTAYLSLGLGSFVLVGMFIASSTISILLIVFLSSLLSALAWPAMRGLLSDSITDSPKAEPEIEGLGDFAGNTGYIIGPALAGFTAEFLGEFQAFGLLGLIGILVAGALMLFTKKQL